MESIPQACVTWRAGATYDLGVFIIPARQPYIGWRNRFLGIDSRAHIRAQLSSPN
jgi:hypothetical protein